jgi:hypothetical protein
LIKNVLNTIRRLLSSSDFAFLLGKRNNDWTNPWLTWLLETYNWLLHKYRIQWGELRKHFWVTCWDAGWREQRQSDCVLLLSICPWSCKRNVKGKWWITSLWAARDVSRLTSMFALPNMMQGLLPCLPFWFPLLLVSKVEWDVICVGELKSEQWTKAVLCFRIVQHSVCKCYTELILFFLTFVDNAQDMFRLCVHICLVFITANKVWLSVIISFINVDEPYVCNCRPKLIHLPNNLMSTTCRTTSFVLLYIW